MSENAKKVAIITGASKGIGAEIAERLASEGFVVVINYAGDTALAEELARKIEEKGGRALTAKADVSNPEDVRRMFEATETAFGGVDVLVNNAGVMQLSPIRDVDDAQFDRHVAVNLKGTFNTLREAAKRMRDGGRIVNFSTSVVGTRLETYGVYTATKAAVETLTMIMAKEMRGRSITVNAVAPGPTGTDLFLHGKSDELIARFAKGNPLERLGTPDDIASVVSFLVSPQGGWINGQTIRANGGLV
ncbi:SDR family oxidoreductase [Rhizobium sp. BK251]|uniref:SDR family oxidoreductase n=1 Tax=Rhizobium sp. BK251 TaxID=2512125 RepID=UPI001049390E|nr:SDR family oxidoreductase [Rhizobium sp. BK251]TCL65148.1 3-oxoacyl-[acyl-carrier protein] reductase [Rhizobium sp. BK251]